MSPVLYASRTILEGLNEVHICFEDENSSDPSNTIITDCPCTPPSAVLSPRTSLLSTESTPLAELKRDEAYVTLSVTLPYTTYTSTVLLGNTFTTSKDLAPTTYALPATSNVRVEHPGTATGTIAGIAVGLTLGFLALCGVLYVYLLRARQLRRRRRRRRSRRGSSVTAEGAPPAAPEAPEAPEAPPGPGPGPFPPAE